MPTPKALILRAPGTNCDREAEFAFQTAGAEVRSLHINAIRANPKLLHNFQILVVPGGFSYGDDIAAGKVLALQFQHFLADALRKFRDDEKLILGICNGFQVLLKAGLIIPPDDDGPLATLGFNDSGRFEDRWIHLQATPGNCPFLTGIDRLHAPVAHGEGKFLCRKEWIVRGLSAQTDQIVLRYVDETGRRAGYPVNPNGSQDDIAGVCDASGRVLGLMPHPERHVLGTQHPQWTRHGLKDEGEGLKLFRNAVGYFK
jgi:phosphoribosylformylglycinamidine synthase subunit PurQ / glutaminase